MTAFRGAEPGAPADTIPPHPKHGTEETAYPYRDEHGGVLFYVCRYKTRSGKTFLQGRPTDGGTGWAWNLRGLEPVLYRLPEVQAFIDRNAEHEPLYIVEGEKDAERLHEHLDTKGLAGEVTTNPMGAGKWRESYTDALRGLRFAVVIVDNDDVGTEHGLKVVAELRAAGVPRVELRKPAPAEPKSDLTDHLDAGYTLDELEHLSEAPDVADLAEGPLLMDVADFVRVQVEPPLPLWGTHDQALLVEGGFGLFAGRPGSGKTTFIIDLACHLAAGLPYPPTDPQNQRAPKPFPVPRPLRIALIENEGPLELFRAKMHRKLEAFGLETITTAGGALLVQVWRWGAFSFADDDAFAKARLELDLAGIDLVIGDPLNMLGVEGVGSPSDTAAFVRRLRLLGMGVRRSFLMIHHFRERVDTNEDELRKLSGSWGGHLDTLITLAQGAGEAEARLAFPKLRWAHTEPPPPIVLGRVYNVAGFEALGLEHDVALLEPKLVENFRAMREAGDGFGPAGRSGWMTARNVAGKIKSGKGPTEECLKAGAHLFTMVTGEAAKDLGARKDAKLWGLAEWRHELGGGEPAPASGPVQGELGDPGPDPDDGMDWR